ncbi:GlxA family transcriptional regulator [Phytoactinopolyspora endophytica]|uniref:GlxA family transcriptional regulator n=1 Tax=Phytoactinopolyspora endophytica TaxID=1642495 RepID=UPI00101D71A7|nr:helix-turn-helix domain-containing protein [Phytoactinopolyspora endophytica]
MSRLDVARPRRIVRPHRVVVIAMDGIIPFEFSVPARLFGAALDETGRPHYEVVTASMHAEPVRTSADFVITPGESLVDAIASADTVVIPALELATMDPHQVGAVVETLHHRRRGSRIISICTGAHVLAVAGLLDGRPATTHWNHAAEFSREFPAVLLDPDVLFVDDGDVLTSAGAAAGVDLCLHLIRRDQGSTTANAVARSCVVAPWREGGQAQFIDAPMPDHEDASTASTRAWAMERLDADLTLASMAKHASMSIRTFTRRFRDETGTSPNRWLTRQRVDYARRLLESTDLPIDQIAGATGLGTSASLRSHLRTAIGVSPSTYRRTFQAQPAPRLTPSEFPRNGTTTTPPSGSVRIRTRAP